MNEIAKNYSKRDLQRRISSPDGCSVFFFFSFFQPREIKEREMVCKARGFIRLLRTLGIVNNFNCHLLPVVCIFSRLT